MASIYVFSQSTPTSVKYNKVNRAALTLVLPYTEEIAEGTIVQKLKEIGYNPETKGALFWKKEHCRRLLRFQERGTTEYKQAVG